VRCSFIKKILIQFDENKSDENKSKKMFSEA